jgi:hypothetical protein
MCVAIKNGGRRCPYVGSAQMVKEQQQGIYRDKNHCPYRASTDEQFIKKIVKLTGRNPFRGLTAAQRVQEKLRLAAEYDNADFSESPFWYAIRNKKADSE